MYGMKLILTTLLFILTLQATNFAIAQENNKQEVLASIGRASKWNNVNYLLFTSSNGNNIFKERSFLINKSSGQVRFDGITNNKVNLTLLFNYKSKTLDKSFVNGKLEDSKSIIQFSSILDQFFEDSKLLFLPMFIISNPNNISIGHGKIINSQKLIELDFKNIYCLNKQPLSGSTYLNNRGEIIEYHIDQSNIMVGEFKDIGDGLLLPTRFTFKNKKSSIKFNTVAAFTNIEADRFTNL